VVYLPKDHYMDHFTSEKDYNHVLFERSWFIVDRSNVGGHCMEQQECQLDVLLYE